MANVTKKKGTTKEGIVIQNISIRPVVRSTQDIQKWRTALKSAEAIIPIRIPLYDLYEDILLDGTLDMLVRKRILGVTKTRLTFVDGQGNQVPEVSDLTKTMQFRYLRKEIQYQKIIGISLIELTRNASGLNVYSVPRKHIRADLGKIVYEQYGTDGIDYTSGAAANYIFQVGDRYDLGLLLKASQYVIYKRGGFGDWSKFAEIFGMPFREARYDGFNDEVRRQLELAMDEAGSAPYIILPKDADFKLHDVRNPQSSGQLYDGLRSACNQELCILTLGQTETTTSSSSSGYAQSETHADVEDSLNEDDRMDELGILNEKVLPILESLGYPVTGGRFEHIPPEDKISMVDKATVLGVLKNDMKLPIGDDYLYDEFGVPKPDDYEEQKAKQGASPEPPKTGNGPNKNGIPPDDEEDDDPRLTISAWNKLRHKLADFFDPAPPKP